ncbi:MAG: hypothetical protein AAGD38_16725 [Acidobacteriota bacterium]
MLQEIKLNLINNSQDINNSEVLIFQKNVAESFSEISVAWRVIQNLGVQDHHPFTYPLNFFVSAGDSFGNFTPQLEAFEGQAYEVIKDRSGDVLRPSPFPSSSPLDVEVRNNLQTGGVSANIFRDGKLLATKTNVSPAQKAVFRFKPRIFIGVVSQVREGQILDSAIVQQVNTEIDLLGIKSADIIMTGGGGGPSATAFQFQLSNVNRV